MSSKKVVLFIVEGITDEDSLSGILNKLTDQKKIKFLIIREDITLMPGVSTRNIKERIKERIDGEIKQYKLKSNDICQIIHLVDTDGCFIHEKYVFQSSIGKTIYEENGIYAKIPEKIIERNQLKTRVLNVIWGIKELTVNRKKISYRTYYFSSNLEHVLHNLPNAEREKKEQLADAFSESFENRELAFIGFINEPEYAVNGSYEETWSFIQKDLNSVKRYTNFCLYFEDLNFDE